MNVPITWIAIVYVMFFVGPISTDIDSNEFFCGQKLVTTLKELCAIYNSPEFARRQRLRRRIVEECCHTQCSRRYLLQNYCSEVNKSIIQSLLNNTNSTNSTLNNNSTNLSAKSSHLESNSLTVRNREEQGNNHELLSTSLHSDSFSPHHHPKKSRGKRNCKCRKRRVKRVKKSQALRAAPPPNIGQIEDSQSPFYVWKFARMI